MGPRSRARLVWQAFLFAFLDDIYVVCPLERVGPCTSCWSTHCEQKSASAFI